MNDFKLSPFSRVEFNDDEHSGDFVNIPSNNEPEESKEPSKPDGKESEENYTLRSFKSTPMFIESLTDLSVKVLHSETDMKQTLIDGLKVINKGLPSNIYIPFVNNSWRNYTILNICENESKLFLTNTRAPYLICLEIYRPEEILVTS